jgi:hypothetical protein
MESTKEGKLQVEITVREDGNNSNYSTAQLR